MLTLTFDSKPLISKPIGFYESLGCDSLSAVVKESCAGLHEIPATGTCDKVRSLILERLPLFVAKIPDGMPNVVIRFNPEHFQVKACERIVVRKTLTNPNVNRTKKVWAIAKHEGDNIELWISKAAKRDMYE